MKKAPVFVKIEEYRDVLDILSMLKEKVGDAKNILSNIEKVKEKEDEEIKRWKGHLEDVGDKVSFIDKKLYEIENV